MTQSVKNDESASFVVLRCNRRLCALPVAQVSETMRCQPIDPMPDMPAFLLGVAIIRGLVVPVVDLACVLGAGKSSRHRRFVTIKLGTRRIAFAVDEVIGVRRLLLDATAKTPPLLGLAEAGVIDAMKTLDAELILVLQAAHLIADALWESIEHRDSRA